MKKIPVLLVAAAGLALVLPGCYEASKGHEDAVQDIPHDTPPEEVADTPDTPDIPDTPELDVEPDVPVQGPITFVVNNTAAQTRYVDWSYGETEIFAGDRTTGGAWAQIDFWSPGCMFDCAETGTGDECCIMCEAPLPAVREIPAGGRIGVAWDGVNVFEIDYDYCTCNCYWTRPPVPMAYRVTACVYPEFSCDMPPCTPDEDGVYAMAYGQGTRTCYETIFDIPYAASEVVVDVE
jgi:hypothetical protein